MLSPAQKQSVGVDFQGTTTGAYPGLESNFSYRNRNAFQGSEIFEFKVYGRAESQRVGGADVPFSVQSLFNTLEVGNEISIRTPKFLVPFRVFRYSKRNTPFTTIRVNNAYQTRPDYSRFISTFSFGYEWQETEQKFHRFIPLEFSAIRVQKTAAFQEIINASNDLFLRNSFSDQILFHNLYSYNYSNYTAGKKGNYLAFRGNIQLGGNLLFLAGLAGAFPRDQSERFTILNTPFAQFVRLEPDLRSYFVFSEKHSLALRGLLGVGVPYLNSKSLPFEKSFSAGGATDIRGWRARRLGPGSFNQGTGFAFDQFADLKLLLQAEYRFTVIKQIELALFADAGNIWAMNSDANRPLAHFDIRRFYKEIALGAGLGLRLNLGFFIFRVDPGIPIYDPTVGPGENLWVLPYLKWKSVVWNFAINYPF
jgi:outer membrane protein assembly factor BamA